MARAVNKLTALGLSKTKEPGRYGDGAGLYLVIDPNGSRRWIMIFRHGGKQREMGLGSANVISLADARRKRDETHRLIAEGRDPIAEKRRPDPATVKGISLFPRSPRDPKREAQGAVDKLAEDPRSIPAIHAAGGHHH